jgi:hypothetical protein
MALNAADRLAFVTAIFDTWGEDYDQMGRLVHNLQLNLPGEDWEAAITTFAASYQPFIDSGLSIDWWVQTVMDRANSMG